VRLGRRKATDTPHDEPSRPIARQESPSPFSARPEDRTAAVEDAIVSINDSISKLTAEIERIDRIVDAKSARPDPA
jgi:hypothetical protein